MPLEASEPPLDLAATTAGRSVAQAVRQSNACSQCHYLDDAGAGKGPGIDPDGPHKAWRFNASHPQPRPWPSNVSYSIYAGKSPRTCLPL